MKKLLPPSEKYWGWELEDENEDLQPMSAAEIKKQYGCKNSSFVVLKAGDVVTVRLSQRKKLTGTILGFSSFEQKTRIALFEFEDGYGSMDLLCDGHLLVDAKRNGKPVPAAYEFGETRSKKGQK
jgi:hypothetical protein